MRHQLSVAGVSAGNKITGTATDGSNNTSEFGANFTVTDALPIQLSSFNAQTLGSGNLVSLRWTTLTETNNYGFYIQRRAGKEQNFTELPSSFVAGHGTTLQPQEYSFTDGTVAAGQWSYRLKQFDLDGTVHFTDAVSVDVLTDVKEQSLPAMFVLEQNYPQPFNPSTTIAFSLPADANVSLEVFDVLGSRVAELASGRMGAGNHTVVFDASQLSSGLYFYRLAAGDYVQTKKLTVLR